ncbi:hypothetical protein ABZ942_02025 [Nocardia sp. NPDC046473]|uniref:hypothetical protein n=1 Tax=Nocardia sp. NPDC046473 TaxID=3155733 RepID=UPI0033E5307D
MPQLWKFDDLNRDKLSRGWPELAEAIRVLIRQTGLSCKAIEEAIKKKLADLRDEGRQDWAELKKGYLSKSVLADLANGNRKRSPKKAPLRELHCLALANAAPDEQVIMWEELERLRKNAGAKPAETTPAVAAGVAPVPSLEGDRRNNLTVDVAWPPAKDLGVYISTGKLERANSLIRHVGTEAAPVEAASAIASCRILGLHDAAEGISSYAETRPDLDVLHILHSLKQQGRHADADALLDRVLARTRANDTFPRAS